jgi:hypothetical protein
MAELYRCAIEACHSTEDSWQQLEYRPRGKVKRAELTRGRITSRG